jgi:hypothetical protein
METSIYNLKTAGSDRLLDAAGIRNREQGSFPYFPYVEQPPAEKAKLENGAFELRCKYLRRLQKAIRLDL